MFIPYTIKISSEAERQIKKLDRAVQRRIEPVIDALAKNPRPAGAKKMEGYAGRYRVRIGDYRIVYEVYDRELVVLIIRAGNRKEIYR